MNTMKLCPKCGKTLAPDALLGLCPECMMKAGLETEPPPGDLAGSAAPAFDVADMAAHFPQLEILELLGQGGMGVVYKARQRGLDRLVALKLLSTEAAKDPSFAQRFSQEARSLARLNHPNIVTVYDFGQSGPFYYFLMEFVDGATVRQMLRAGQITPREVLALVPRICEALQYAHDEGIVHRDIKPENLLVSKKGQLKIADFGIARLLGRSPMTRLTQGQQIIGTPQYMAPEQLEHPLDVDHRADIYSLGVVFYEMLTGELPLGRFDPPSHKVQVDVRLDEVVLRALEKEPARRYQHASEVKTDVETIAGFVEKLPPQMRMAFGFEYRSTRTLFGLPLFHFAFGLDPVTGKKRVAKGIVAVGDVAKGVVAIGGLAMGGFAFGGMSLGLLSVGGMTLGLFSVGGLSLGLVFSIGGLALGTIAYGGAAVGYYATGGWAAGIHALGANARDPEAMRFFKSFLQSWINLAMVALLVPSVLMPLLVIWARHKAMQAGTARQPETAGGKAASVTPPASSPNAAAPRFSRKAILGALWPVLFFLAVFSLVFVRIEAWVGPLDAVPAPHTDWWQTLLAFTLLPLGLAAPIGTTVLGFLALHDIRHSKGALGGLVLALADALFFPLLLLDGLILYVWYQILLNAAGPAQMHVGSLWMLAWILLSLATIGFVDWLLVRASWRAVSKPV